MFSPFFAGIAPKAIGFAAKHLTPEGMATIIVLLIVSIFSWTVIITKGRQLRRARKMAKRFFEAYRASRDPLELYRKKEEFDGAPAYELYMTGAEEMDYHLKNNPVPVVQVKPVGGNDAATFAQAISWPAPFPRKSATLPSSRCRWPWNGPLPWRPCRWSAA